MSTGGGLSGGKNLGKIKNICVLRFLMSVNLVGKKLLRKHEQNFFSLFEDLGFCQ